MGAERTHTVSVRLSPGEYAVWVAAARGDGRGRLGAWVRDRVAATLPARSVPAAAVGVSAGADGGSRWVVPVPSPAPSASVGVLAPAEWASLRAELGRVGNNLNQAVRSANAGGVNPARVVEMADAAERTRVVIARLLAVVRVVAADRVVPVSVPPAPPARGLVEQVADADRAEAERRAATQPRGPVPGARRRPRPVLSAAVVERVRERAAERAAGRAAAAAAVAMSRGER